MSAARHVVNVARLPAHLPSSLPCLRPSRSFSTSASSSDLRRSASFLQRVDKILAEDVAHEDREIRSSKHRLQQADLRPRRKDKVCIRIESKITDLHLFPFCLRPYHPTHTHRLRNLAKMSSQIPRPPPPTVCGGTDARCNRCSALFSARMVKNTRWRPLGACGTA